MIRANPPQRVTCPNELNVRGVAEIPLEQLRAQSLDEELDSPNLAKARRVNRHPPSGESKLHGKKAQAERLWRPARRSGPTCHSPVVVHLETPVGKIQVGPSPPRNLQEYRQWQIRLGWLRLALRWTAGSGIGGRSPHERPRSGSIE